MRPRNTQIVVTLGPATFNLEALRRMKARAVDFVRTNMSHSSLADLRRAMAMARKVGIPFIIDTEGSQVRTCEVEGGSAWYDQDDEVVLAAGPQEAGRGTLPLRPPSVLLQLAPGDLVHIDFDSLVLRVTDTSAAARGRVRARVVTGGSAGRNKAVVIDPVFTRRFDLPAVTEKDYESIAIGLREGVEHVALSYVRSVAAIEEVRRITEGRMKVISKIECTEALCGLDEIIGRSDALLIDRGDLSKEIPIERIPFVQKIVIEKARARGVGVFVATNLLETMVERRKPTRAEIQDIVNTIVDGASGLTLAAETAIGKHPIECVNMLNRLIGHAETVLAKVGPGRRREDRPFVSALAASGYLTEPEGWSSLVPPHGGRLVDRMIEVEPAEMRTGRLATVALDRRQQMDLRQIAAGSFSPLEGFMGRRDLDCVLREMRLADGTPWPLPVLLDVSAEQAAGLQVGEVVGLTDEEGTVLGLLDLQEKYAADPPAVARSVHGTLDTRHPGVGLAMRMRPVLLAGRVSLVRPGGSETREYELSPRQTRRLFSERGWVKVLAFHTRDALDREHELLQLQAMERESCDGLLVHPVIGDRRAGELRPWYVIKSYEQVMERFYPRDRALLAALPSWCRHAGARETLFWAICRMNFGCSHFVAGGGRADRPGLPDLAGELGITILEPEAVLDAAPAPRRRAASVEVGGAASRLLERGKMPPAAVMRREVSRMILDAMRDGEKVFVTAAEE